MKDGREYTLKHEAKARAKHKKTALKAAKEAAKPAYKRKGFHDDTRSSFEKALDEHKHLSATKFR